MARPAAPTRCGGGRSYAPRSRRIQHRAHGLANRRRFWHAGGRNRLGRLCGKSPDRSRQRQRLCRPRGRSPKFVQRLWHVRGRLACGQSRRMDGGGLESRLCVDTGYLACGRGLAGLGRRGSAVSYNYGNNVTYQDDQVTTVVNRWPRPSNIISRLPPWRELTAAPRPIG